MHQPRNHERAEEWVLAEAVRYLLRRGGWPARTCRPDHLRRIEADTPLAAYLRAVQQADSWDEEIARVRHRQMERRRQRRMNEESAEGAGLSISAVLDLIPTWRDWGRLLLTADS